MAYIWAFVVMLHVSFSQNAWAQDAAPEPSVAGSFLPLILIFVVFYFLIIRPQSKKIKAHAQMVQDIQKGDEVITAGGVVGKVKKLVGEDRLEVEVAKGVSIVVIKSTVADSPKDPAKAPTSSKK